MGLLTLMQFSEKEARNNYCVCSSGASINSDSSSGYMVGETESARSYQFSGIPGSEDSVFQSSGLNQFCACQIYDWTVENVKHWLIGIEMERFSDMFTETGNCINRLLCRARLLLHRNAGLDILS
ncbi:hypothetical protein DPMN_184580 [Dreissena polymorpha]|uniref:SAM domain-containing protein n=1 Tax=Dreissena polymorpha TaxID=45954 RepID=A0A9D4DM31_DREPO|nr:hypothetical protein DPMN_184580 [Dreissena polymorpha]